MVKTCYVKDCLSENYVGCGLSFHKFPQNEALKKKWFKVVGQADSKFASICSKHFKPEDYYENCKNKLKSNVVPSVQLSCIREDYSKYGSLCEALVTKDKVPPDSQDEDTGTSEPSEEGGFSDKDDIPLRATNTLDVIDKLGWEFEDSKDSNADVTADAVKHTLEKNPSPNKDVGSINSNTATKAQQDDQSGSGSLCNVCEQEIIGYRYVCVQCFDWDMCGDCEAAGSHNQHYVLRLPKPNVPQIILITMIETIQEKLKLLRVVNKFNDDVGDASMEYQMDDLDLDTFITPKPTDCLENDQNELQELLPEEIDESLNDSVLVFSSPPPSTTIMSATTTISTTPSSLTVTSSPTTIEKTKKMDTFEANKNFNIITKNCCLYLTPLSIMGQQEDLKTSEIQEKYEKTSKNKKPSSLKKTSVSKIKKKPRIINKTINKKVKRKK